MTIAFTNRPRTAHYVIDSFSGTGTTWVEYRGFARNNVERFAWGRGELTVDGDEIPIVIHAKGMLYERTGAAARFEASCRITQKVAR